MLHEKMYSLRITQMLRAPAAQQGMLLLDPTVPNRQQKMCRRNLENK
jgi:hypothetical protein